MGLHTLCAGECPTGMQVSQADGEGGQTEWARQVVTLVIDLVVDGSKPYGFWLKQCDSEGCGFTCERDGEVGQFKERVKKLCERERWEGI